MKPFALILLLACATPSRAPEPPTLAQLADKAYTSPAPQATVPARFLLHTHAGTLYRLDTATGQTWEITHTQTATGHTVSAWTRTTESHMATLQMIERLKSGK